MPAVEQHRGVAVVYEGIEIRMSEGGYYFFLPPNLCGACSTLEQARRSIDEALEKGQRAPLAVLSWPCGEAGV